jgi:hypothetical protein
MRAAIPQTTTTTSTSYYRGLDSVESLHHILSDRLLQDGFCFYDGVGEHDSLVDPNVMERLLLLIRSNLPVTISAEDDDDDDDTVIQLFQLLMSHTIAQYQQFKFAYNIRSSIAHHNMNSCCKYDLFHLVQVSKSTYYSTEYGML